ncbi:MAG: hypothetical protein GY721_12360, partial [Deltaproteobacteria bacterium]|nr:hypothetical protein [Deltaproteobacteria bacterium]
FGDSTAPYIFQKTRAGLQHYLLNRGWTVFARYLDDIAAAVGYNEAKAAELTSAFRDHISQMGWVLSVKKCPPISLEAGVPGYHD